MITLQFYSIQVWARNQATRGWRTLGLAIPWATSRAQNTKEAQYRFKSEKRTWSRGIWRLVPSLQSTGGHSTWRHIQFRWDRLSDRCWEKSMDCNARFISVSWKLCKPRFRFYMWGGVLHKRLWYAVTDIPGYSGDLSLKWLAHFGQFTSRRKTGVYCLLLLDGYGSHCTKQFIDCCDQ